MMMMEVENEQPNLVVPRPFPQEPSEVLERSVSLDVTPERVLAGRRRTNRKKHKSGHEDPASSKSPFPAHLSYPPSRPADLCTPQLNSTALLLSRVHTMKQQEKQLRSCGGVMAEPSRGKTASAGAVMPEPRVPSLHQVGDLEGMLQRPLKEVNIPRNTTRYKDLIPVDVSDESFQKLTFKPRKPRNAAKLSSDAPKEPQIMDFMVPSLECEEADWNTTCHAPASPKPVLMDSADVYAIQDFIRSLKH